MKKEIDTTTSEESLCIAMAFCNYYRELKHRAKEKTGYNPAYDKALSERLEPLYNTLYDNKNYATRIAEFQFFVVD